MGNKNSGNYENGKLTLRQKSELLRKYKGGQKLRQQTDELGLSVAQLSKEYGVSSQYIWSLANPRPQKSIRKESL